MIMSKEYGHYNKEIVETIKEVLIEEGILLIQPIQVSFGEWNNISKIKLEERIYYLFIQVVRHYFRRLGGINQWMMILIY